MASAQQHVGFRPRRRNLELLLVLFAQSLGLGGYVLAHLALYNEVPPKLSLVAALWFGLGIAAHISVRIFAREADPLLLPIPLLLNGLGLAMIYRIDQIPDPVRYSAHWQLAWTGLGILLLIGVLAFLKDHRRLQRYTYLLFIVGLGLLLMPLLPGIGHRSGGAQIWIRIGGFSFQPAEIAKIVLAVAFASYFFEKKDVLAVAGKRFLGLDLPRARDLGPIMIMWLAVVAVMVFQNDLGTALLFFGLFAVMIYIATEKAAWPVLAVGGFLAAAVLAYFATVHVPRRVNAWLDPFSDFDANYQIISAQYGYAWGGLMGRGWGYGRPGLTPLPRSDFIAASLAEEIGLVGLIAIVVLYWLLVMRGMRAALATRDGFGKLLAGGLSFIFALQVFAIIGGITRLLPLTGLTTPFMSQGGSSLVANWIIIGMLLIISHQARQPSPLVADPVSEVPA
ncbi:MAG: cell division protein [Arachnia propionica]|nr:MAG: cell division protein [Arachnia propionica]